MKMKNLPVLLAYCIPWAFLMLYGDVVYGWAWQYLLMTVCMAVLAWLGVKSGGILLTGNAFSLAVSLLCVQHFGFAERNHYFKPFGAFGWTILLALLSALVQWLVWKKQWLLLGLLAAAAGIFLGGAYWLYVSM